MKIRVFALVVSSMLLSPAGFAKKGASQVVIAAVAAPGLPGLERTLTRNPDELDVFYQAPNGGLAMNWAVGPWNTPSPITPPGAGRPNSPIAAAINEKGFLQAFYVQRDGAIGSAMRAGGWEANAITQANLVRGDSPLAVAKMRSLLWILFITPDGSVAGMDAPPVIAAAPAPYVNAFRVVPAGSVGNGSGLAFVPNSCGWSTLYQAVTGALVEDWFTDIRRCPSVPTQKTVGRWSIVPPGAGNPRTPIAVLTRGNDQLHVFFVRPDGAIATTWRDDQHSWASPFPITPPGAARGDSPLSAVVRGGDQLHVFYIGRDGAIATTWAVGPWAKPFAITPPGAAGPGSGLGAVVRRDQLHVFYQGPDGAIVTNWAIGPWQTPFPITPPGAAGPGSAITVVTGR